MGGGRISKKIPSMLFLIMIVKRMKAFSLLGKLKNIFTSDKSKEEVGGVMIKKPSIPVKRDYITFEEGYNKDYWPALVVVRIKSEENKVDGGWTDFVYSMMHPKNFFKSGGELIGIHELSKKDNVNGNSGSNAVVLVFSGNTKIDSAVRLAYSKYFKWPEDFFSDYNSFYTWYKSGKKLFK